MALVHKMCPECMGIGRGCKNPPCHGGMITFEAPDPDPLTNIELEPGIARLKSDAAMAKKPNLYVLADVVTAQHETIKELRQSVNTLKANVQCLTNRLDRQPYQD